MAKIRLTFTDEHIRLIKALRPFVFDNDIVGLNPYNMYGGGHLYEDMARILDLMDKADKSTLDDAEGVRFDDETMKHLIELDEFISSNLSNIEEILHQFADEGIKAGVTYECSKTAHIWGKGIETETK